MLIIKDDGGRDRNNDHVFKIQTISALDVGNGHFGFWAPFSYVGGLLHVYICVGINGEAMECNSR